VELRHGVIDEGCQEGVIEVHVDIDGITRTAGVFGPGTAHRLLTGGIGTGVEGAEAAAHRGWIEDIGGVAAGADGYVKIAFCIFFTGGTDGIIVENAKAPLFGLSMNVVKAKCIHLCGICAARAWGVGMDCIVRAFGHIVFACLGDPQCLAGDVLYGKPGAKQHRKIDDPEDDH
jgi:hypothetical protein